MPPRPRKNGNEPDGTDPESRSVKLAKLEVDHKSPSSRSTASEDGWSKYNYLAYWPQAYAEAAADIHVRRIVEKELSEVEAGSAVRNSFRVLF